MLQIIRRVTLALTLGVGCLFLSGPNLADEASLPADHGYMLIRLKLTASERADLLAMSNVDTDNVVTIRRKSFEQAGLNAWMALVAMPNGRYFWSKYQPTIGTSAAEVERLATRHRRSAPGSASDTFEIVAGAVNYVGDWTMRVDATRRMQLNPIIEFDKSTLERYLTQYPEISNKYQIYLSAMGKKAISLTELAKSTE